MSKTLYKSDRCSNPACGKTKGRQTHHIIFRSQMEKCEWRESRANLITLCMDCHEFPHGRNNPKIDGVRVTGRQWMISLLEKLGTHPEALALLKKKEGTYAEETN